MSLYIPKFRGCPAFPTNPRSAEQWDLFWEDVIRLSGTSRIDFGSIRQDYTDFQYVELANIFIRLGLNHVLIAGNGLSILPYCLAKTGLQCSVIDSSVVATDFVKGNPPSLNEINVFFQRGGEMFPRTNPASTDDSAEQNVRPEYPLEFFTSDLFDLGEQSDRCDVIVAQNVFDHYTGVDRRTLADVFYKVIRPGGILVIESQNGVRALDTTGKIRQGFEDTIENAGFKFHLKNLYNWRREEYERWHQLRDEKVQPRVGLWNFFRRNHSSNTDSMAHLNALRSDIDEEFVRRWRIEEERSLCRLESGEKLVVFRQSR